jgi:SUF system FeS cluster assembly, SufBD
MIDLSNREKEILGILGINLDGNLTIKKLLDEVKENYKAYKNNLQKPSSNAFPKIIMGNNTSTVEHEASVGSVSEKQLFYLQSKGLNKNSAISLIVTNNFSEILSNLPLEFAIEAKKLIELNLTF